MLFAFADINANAERIVRLLEDGGVARKKRLKRTAEERRRWQENQPRLERLIELRLERDGVSRDEIRRRFGLPS